MTPIFRLESVRELKGRWIRIKFSQSFRGQPVRPLLRLHRLGAPVEEHILPAAVLGKARWIGLAPNDLCAFEILTVSGDAPDVRIDSVDGLSELRVAGRIAFQHPASFGSYLYCLLLRRNRARAVLVRSLLDLSSTEKFQRYEVGRTRTYEPDGIDAGILSADRAFVVLFVLAVPRGSHEAAIRTLQSLAGQIDANYRLLIGFLPGESQAIREAVDRLGLNGKVRFLKLPVSEPAARAGYAMACSSSSDWVTWLEPGDQLSSEAVLLIRDYIVRFPRTQILYADSINSRGGASRDPELKPDWSAEFLRHVDYVGRPCIFRKKALDEVAPSVDATHCEPWWAALNLAGEGRTRAEIVHLKRPLLARSNAGCSDGRSRSRPASPAVRRGTGLQTSIIIPTRDRVDLLRRAVSSIVDHAGDRTDYEIIIVDNGSAEAGTLAYLSAVHDGLRTRVLRYPGPFNYPDLVNAGANAATGDVLVLLNNDCMARDGAWLDAMTRLAIRSDVGAVGAILLYEDGRIQHAGVALGLGGEAGHRDRKSAATYSGNLGRLKAVHEVSAVTAACLAVERAKYNQVGGFDRTFAVAFNDIDFCLKLQARGFRNLLTPEAILTHAESASRGPESGAKRARFEAEAALFRERWRPLIHDDPYFHPMFSTTRFNDQLG